MIAVAWAVAILAVAVCVILGAGMLCVCVLCAAGVALIVSRQLLDLWAGHPAASPTPARRTPP